MMSDAVDTSKLFIQVYTDDVTWGAVLTEENERYCFGRHHAERTKSWFASGCRAGPVV